MGLGGLKAMFPGAPDDFYKDAQPLAGEKHKMLEARVAKLEEMMQNITNVLDKRIQGCWFNIETLFCVKYQVLRHQNRC